MPLFCRTPFSTPLPSVLRRPLSSQLPKPKPSGPKFSTPVSWASFGVASAVGAGIYAYYTHAREEKLTRTVQKSTTIGKALLGGPFSLVDSTGVPVTDATFLGEWVVLYFGFSYCPDICPNELVKLDKALQRLDAMKGVGPVITPVFISVDSKRDSVQQLANYKKDFHPRMRFLTGTPQQVKKAARAYRVYFSDTNKGKEEEEEDEEEEDWDYLVDHSIVMYFLSPEGEFLEFFTQIAEVDEIVERIADHVQKR